MTAFDRRRLFSLGAATAGAAAVPGWLARWFAPAESISSRQDPQKAADEARVKQLANAIERAQKEGKPLVLFVVPEDLRQGGWQRGRWFGAFLNHAPAFAKMEMAMTVLACAKASELKKLTGAEVTGKPQLVVVDVVEGRRARKPSRVTPVEIELGNLGLPSRPEEKWQDRLEREKKYIQERVDALGAELIKAMHRQGHNVASVAKRSMRSVKEKDKVALETWFAGGKKPGDAIVVQAAAEVRRVAAGKEGVARKAMLRDLVKAFERHVVKQPVAGARWMIPGGCGAEPETKTKEEKENHLRIACGMAHTPQLCERFLSFFASL